MRMHLVDTTPGFRFSHYRHFLSFKVSIFQIDKVGQELAKSVKRKSFMLVGRCLPLVQRHTRR
jgi:hypothetical protein